MILGGYYFGSVDQERYSIQRHARKINGRVFGVSVMCIAVIRGTQHISSHQLSTCASISFPMRAARCDRSLWVLYCHLVLLPLIRCIPDIYLIRPPPESAHKPVDPGHIVIAGDSAGGGLSLALLQVIRDSGLPTPAGGVLISPWCDLTHSFASVHANTHSVRIYYSFYFQFN